MNLFGGKVAEKQKMAGFSHDHVHMFRLGETVFRCGPSKCDHDYTKWVEYKNPDGGMVGTAVCSKCDAHAFDESRWY